MSPEALSGGAIGRVKTGDIIHFDAEEGSVVVDLSDEELNAREPAIHKTEDQNLGRNLFDCYRNIAGISEDGATVFSFGEKTIHE